MRRSLSELSTDRRGATAIEYGLVVALIAVTALVGMSRLGDSVTNLYGNVRTGVQRAM